MVCNHGFSSECSPSCNSSSPSLEDENNPYVHEHENEVTAMGSNILDRSKEESMDEPTILGQEIDKSLDLPLNNNQGNQLSLFQIMMIVLFLLRFSVR